MAAGGTVGLLGGGGFLAGTILAFGVAMAGFMAPSLTNMHAVNWDTTGIEGPSKTLGLTLGSARASLVWRVLVGSGKTASGYWYVEASDGQRVYWSYLCRGHGALTAAIKEHSPNLTLPEDA